MRKLYTIACLMLFILPVLHAQNVGIGTTTPTQKLDVSGNITTRGSYNLYDGTYNTTLISRYGSYNFGHNVKLVPGAELVIGSGESANAIAGSIAPGTTENLYLTSDGNVYVYTGVQSAPILGLFQNTSGNVGVGNTAPSQKLHVTGNSIVTNNTYIGSTGAYFFSDATNRIATKSQFYVQSTSPNTYLYSTNTYLGNTSGDVIRLRGNTFNWNQGVIQGNGNVGIGTTAPTQKLHVVGNIRATSLVNGIIKADASGNFSVTPLTGSTGDVLLGNGTFGAGSAFGDNLGNHTATTTLNMNSKPIINTTYYSTLAVSSYDKLRVWSSSSYSIGMVSGLTQGYLSDYAMTFTMSNTANRGFLWRDVSDAASDGAMSLTTDGRLYVKSTAHFNGSVGIGTSAPTQKLHVEGNIRIGAGGIIDDDATLQGNSDDWIRLNGYIELKSNTDSYGIVLRDKDNSEYFGITQVNGYSYLTDANSYSSYFLRGNGANVDIRGRAEILSTLDASGTTNTGGLEIANSLRLDGNEIITNSNTALLIQHDNNGDLRVDNNTLMVDASANSVGIGTTTPGAKLHVDGGTNTEVRVISDDGGASTLNLYGSSQGTGRLYVGQSTTHGGGIEYNGDNNPVTSGSGADYITLYRRSSSVDYWTARNKYSTNDWQFREDVDVDGYLTVGNPTTGSAVRKGSKTFVDGSNIVIYNGTYNYNYTWNMGQLTLPSGASSMTVKSITYNITGFNDDNDEDFHIYVKIGSALNGWGHNGGWSFGLSGNDYFDWNLASENLNWNFTSNQTVQFQVYDENETCLFCNNDEVRLYGIEATVYYEYTTTARTGDILAAGRIYANSTINVGDMAEYFPMDEYVNPGDVVSFQKGTDNKYILTDIAYDDLMVGVVSENPSVVLNNPDVGPPVALAGRVKINLASGFTLIKSGDFITSSPIKGKAMKANKAGVVIGYAVANQKKGEEFVEILLQPGRFYYPKPSSDDAVKQRTVINKGTSEEGDK